MVTESKQSVKIFLIYAQEDRTLKQELEKHLTVLLQNNAITLCGEREVQAEADWTRAIDTRLSTADIVLLLTSPDLLNTSYPKGAEMSQIFKGHKERQLSLIPIITRWVDLTGTSLSILQCIPTNGNGAWKPITAWQDRDEAWLRTVTALRRAIKDSSNFKGKQ